MALSLIEQVRLYVGDTCSSPFYPVLSDDEIEFFLTKNGDNSFRAAKQAAISVYMSFAGVPVRERTGDIEVWNNLSKAYLDALNIFLKEVPSSYLESGIMPYAAGISWEDIITNERNLDAVLPELSDVNPLSTCYDNQDNRYQ
jgi:hypothetical protein